LFPVGGKKVGLDEIAASKGTFFPLICGQRRRRRQTLLSRGEQRPEPPTKPRRPAPSLQAFRYGMPPHGGFALRLERWVARVTGAANIRETTLFPRDLNRLSP
jgi:nondiscriminating aspartyl-tRNA synthetase